MLKLLLALILSAISCISFAADNARIKLDDAHLQMQRADGKTPLIYTFPPCSTLELDASAYTLPVPESLKTKGKQANSIQLVLEKDEQYSAAWQSGKSIHLLSETTLKANRGSKPFRGFRKGQEGVVAIGHVDGNNFSVIWVGMFKVQ